MPKPLQIFRPGRQTASSGESFTYTEADLRACASAYDPAKHEAPLVVGHPNTDDPAYGWVKALTFEAGHLEAQSHQVDPAFAELVNGGKFKHMSAAFWRPTAATNPVPGTWYLRHVGFLGAAAPAVKGLKTPTFAGGENGVVSFSEPGGDVVEFSAPIGPGPDGFTAFMAQLRDWLTRQETPAFSAPHLTPDTHAPAAAATKEEPTVTTPTQADLDQRAADLEARENALKQQEGASLARQNAAFCDDLVAKGTLLPVHRDGLVAYMSAQADAPVTFGDAANPTRTTSHAWLKKFLSELPKAVIFDEVAKHEEGDGHAITFAAPPGVGVDKERLAIHQRALAYQSKHGGEYLDAVYAVGGQ